MTQPQGSVIEAFRRQLEGDAMCNIPLAARLAVVIEDVCRDHLDEEGMAGVLLGACTMYAAVLELGLDVLARRAEVRGS